MKILKLSAENFKGLKAVEIEPDGNVVYITGKNGAGKSSVLDSIEACISYPGKKKLPNPIRNGQKKADLILETEKLNIHRIFNNGSTRLEVTNKEGLKFGSPQEVLDEYLGELTLDPTEFMAKDPKGQVELLMKALGLEKELTEISGERQRAYDQRTEVNRELKTCESKIPAEAPERKDPVDVKSLMERLADAERQQKIIDDRKRLLSEESKRRFELLNRIEVLERELAECGDKLNQSILALKEHEAKLGQLEEPAIAKIKDEISLIDDTNRKARAYVEYTENLQDKKRLKDESQKLTRTLDILDRRKQELIASRNFPVEDLTFDEEGVKYRGVTIKQASDAEQIKVSLAIAMALKPELKVIRIRNGSLLDSQMKSVVEEMAEKEGWQIWVEAVDESGKVGFYIEDGELR